MSRVVTLRCFCALAPLLSCAYGVVLVDLRGQTLPLVFAAQTCAGLLNRPAHNDSIAGPTYTLLSDTDVTWLGLIGVAPPTPTPLSAFIAQCTVGAGSVAKGYLRYAFAAQQRIVPNLATVAAVLDLVRAGRMRRARAARALYE
jgi:hypothetical protein